MHRSTVYYLLGIIFTVICVICTVLEYRLASLITGFLTFFFYAFSEKNGRGPIGVYSFIIFSMAYGYIIFPANYALPISMFFLSMVPSIRLIFFKSLGHNNKAYLEVLLYLTGLTLFIAGNLFYHADAMQWTFSGICFLFGAMLTTIFTQGNFEVKRLVNEYLGIKTGSKAPDFTLKDQDGNTVSLSDYRSKRHALLIFVRGDWCPTCHIMLRTYEKEKAKFAEKNIVLLAIGPDPVGVNKAMMDRLNLDYKMLSDEKNEAAKAYGMRFQKNHPDLKFQEGIPLPAAFLIDINGTIRYTTNPKKPGEILRPDMIFPVVEKLQVA